MRETKKIHAAAFGLPVAFRTELFSHIHTSFDNYGINGIYVEYRQKKQDAVR